MVVRVRPDGESKRAGVPITSDFGSCTQFATDKAVSLDMYTGPAPKRLEAVGLRE